MKSKLSLIVIIATVILINSCRQDKYIPNVCFKEDILPIFISKCASPGCHNKAGEEGYNFTTYDGIMKAITANHPLQSEAYTKIKGPNPEMPPKSSPQLTAKEIEKIKFWINFGAENTSCGTSTCDTLTYITYNNTIKDIMTNNCTGCHFTGGPYVILDTYAGVTANAATVITRINLPTSNALHMPQGYPLSSCDIAKIQKWVSLGKPQ